MGLSWEPKVEGFGILWGTTTGGQMQIKEGEPLPMDLLAMSRAEAIAFVGVAAHGLRKHWFFPEPFDEMVKDLYRLYPGWEEGREGSLNLALKRYVEGVPVNQGYRVERLLIPDTDEMWLSVIDDEDRLWKQRKVKYITIGANPVPTGEGESWGERDLVLVKGDLIVEVERTKDRYGVGVMQTGDVRMQVDPVRRREYVPHIFYSRGRSLDTMEEELSLMKVDEETGEKVAEWRCQRGRKREIMYKFGTRGGECVCKQIQQRDGSMEVRLANLNLDGRDELMSVKGWGQKMVTSKEARTLLGQGKQAWINRWGEGLMYWDDGFTRDLFLNGDRLAIMEEDFASQFFYDWELRSYGWKGMQQLIRAKLPSQPQKIYYVAFDDQGLLQANYQEGWIRSG